MAYTDGLVAWWDMSTIHPTNLAPRTHGTFNGAGINLVVATDIVDGVGGGMATEYNGTDERTDCGDIGTIRTIAFWVNPATNTEEIVLIDTGVDIMVNAGTITYTGAVASATYVNGVVSTTLAADLWQHVVCVLDDDTAAGVFALAWDGANYGAVVLDTVMVFDTILTNLQASDLHVRTRRGLL